MDPAAKQDIIIKKSATTKNVLLIVVALAILVGILGVIGYYRLKPSPGTVKVAAERVIAKVGGENIYQSDFDRLLPKTTTALSASESAGFIKNIKNQLVRESIILQGAQADGLITLNETVFNAPEKDYQKRMQLIGQAQTLVENQTPGIEGIIVGIWFNNPPSSPSASLSFEQKKTMALSKINQLRQKVIDKKLTIEEAGLQIREDTTLAQLDTFYKSNALIKFHVKKDQPITSYPEFTDQLKALKEGDVSQIYAVPVQTTKDKNQSQPVVGYLFGQVIKISDQNRFNSFADWLAAKQKIYLVTYY